MSNYAYASRDELAREKVVCEYAQKTIVNAFKKGEKWIFVTRFPFQFQETIISFMDRQRKSGHALEAYDGSWIDPLDMKKQWMWLDIGLKIVFIRPCGNYIQ